MYGLRQARKIAHEDLKTHLVPYGYKPVRFTPGLWKHELSNLRFTLIVDDFGVKFTNLSQAHHLINVLKTKYELSIDWTGSLYCRVSLDWNYKQCEMVFLMPKYVKNLHEKYNHPTPTWQVYTSCKPEPIQYRVKCQTANINTSKPLPPEKLKLLQSKLGTIYYYSRMMDLTTLVANNDISINQASATFNTNDKMNKLMDYLCTNSNAKIKYRVSDMILKIHSDGSYLSVSNSRSRAGGYYYLGDNILPEQLKKLQGSIY